MISEKMQKALNEQINAELYSSYLYLSMASYFLSLNLNGFANWMRVQAQEELVHAMKFFDFVTERSGRVVLAPLGGPKVDWNGPMAAFENTLEHERHITGRINALVDLALAERDHATGNFLQWFVAEQVEEEAAADNLIQQLKLAGDSGHALLMLDRELQARTFVPPAAPAD